MMDMWGNRNLRNFFAESDWKMMILDKNLNVYGDYDENWKNMHILVCVTIYVYKKLAW